MKRRCLQCGQEYEGRPESTLCPACAAKSKASVIRDRICRECGRVFPGGPRAWYCPECRIERKRAADRKAKRNGASRKIGSIDLCEICGKEYTVNSGGQRYCPDCAPVHLKEIDRAQSRAWNHAHIDIDLRRENREQATAERLCAVCGKPFRPSAGDPVTCSPACREIYHRQHAADWERNHKCERNSYRTQKRREKESSMSPEEYKAYREKVNAKARENYKRRKNKSLSG